MTIVLSFSFNDSSTSRLVASGEKREKKKSSLYPPEYGDQWPYPNYRGAVFLLMTRTNLNNSGGTLPSFTDCYTCSLHLLTTAIGDAVLPAATFCVADGSAFLSSSVNFLIRLCMTQPLSAKAVIVRDLLLAVRDCGSDMRAGRPRKCFLRLELSLI